MSSFTLKLIAIITMVIDHTGAILFPGNMTLRIIGRLSFPIFCFLIAEGAYHTRNIKKYMFRLWLFALISEVPYDLAFRGIKLEFSHQNVFFTLGLSVTMLWLFRMTGNLVSQIVLSVLFFYLGNYLHTDYGGLGVILPGLYYVLRNKKYIREAVGAAWNFLFQGIQCYGAFASVPLLLYNGKRGPRLKYFFYIFYPAHLLILYGVKMSGILN